MRLEIHNGLRQPQQIQATRAVIYDDLNNPIALVMRAAHRVTTVLRAGDKGFDDALRMLGVTRTALVVPMGGEELQDIRRM